MIAVLCSLQVTGLDAQREHKAGSSVSGAEIGDRRMIIVF